MSSGTPQDEVLSLGEAAVFLGIKERTLRRWIAERGVPHAKIGGLLRFRRLALLEWIRQHETSNPTTSTRREERG